MGRYHRGKKRVFGGGTYRGLLPFLLSCFSLQLSACVGFMASHHLGVFRRRPSYSRCCLTFHIRRRAGCPPLISLNDFLRTHTLKRCLLPVWPESRRGGAREGGGERGKSEGFWTTTDERVRQSRSVETGARDVYSHH